MRRNHADTWLRQCQGPPPVPLTMSILYFRGPPATSTVLQVTRDQLVELYDTFMAPRAPKLRRLSTHIFAKADAPASLVRVPAFESEFWPVPRDMLSGA